VEDGHLKIKAVIERRWNYAAKGGHIEVSRTLTERPYLDATGLLPKNLKSS